MLLEKSLITTIVKSAANIVEWSYRGATPEPIGEVCNGNAWYR